MYGHSNQTNVCLLDLNYIDPFSCHSRSAISISAGSIARCCVHPSAAASRLNQQANQGISSLTLAQFASAPSISQESSRS
jgi:hypothetical protein